jgi:predicted AlkP superfamily pyrophosphatase or phosphodiesterase
LKKTSLKKTRLEEKQFETALSELFDGELLVKRDEDRLWVNSKELCKEYREYYKKRQEVLLEWVQEWKQQEKIASKLNHFYLEDKLLYDFSEKLLEKASVEILVANPYVERCHLSNLLMDMSEKGVNVTLVTRLWPEQRKRKYLTKLSEKGVAVNYDGSVHSKLIVADFRVAIVSSMNFFAASSGGASWESGLATIDEDVVQSISQSIKNKI